ncbi:hypothetical protein [Kroppenstedtia pulmonis]|uniref:hypothetical protein n=1 Tax=Kroppenstedtia pulmonis TaxID=1380685 RepID=UPI00156425FB|nr:hypothetical protein [Kroppenstedtia pulmonis]
MTEPIRHHSHKIQRGDESMKKQEVQPEEIMIGKTKAIIYCGLNGMTSEERREWFEKEKKKGNPVLKQISRAIFDCQRD